MKLWQVVAVCVLLTLVSSCGKSKDQHKQTLRLNLHSEPPSLDPRKAQDTTSIAVVNMCFEGLTKQSQYGEPTLALAESVHVSEDGLRYTFRLRKAKWSDGVDLTADDFEETWKAILDPAFPCAFAPDLFILKNARAVKEKRASINDIGVDAVDAQTLVVDLEHPAPYFLELLGTHAFLPTPFHIVRLFSDWADQAGEHFVSNGPFKLKEWRHYNQIVVEKNRNYWDQSKVKLDAIQLAIIEDESTGLNMFENDELDWAGHPLSALPIDALQALSKKFDLNTRPISATYYYIFNTKVAPFDNISMRRAFSIAINRKEIVENVTQGKQRPATGIIPPTMWENSTVYFEDGDVKLARRHFKQALKEMKIKKEQLPRITLIYNTSEGHHRIAQAIQQQWKKTFGIEVELENREWKVFLDQISSHKFQVARMGGVASFNDPSTFLDYYKSISSSNPTQWENKEFSDLIEKADHTVDPNVRLELLKKAERVLIDEMPIAPIYFYTGSYLKKASLKGVEFSEMGEVDFKSAYVEE
jgi:oligopeptide transport system substrate-binding protein